MRIRSIKPDFWRSEDVTELSIEDRLLFIGLWSYVDDNGVGKDSESAIIGDLFAADMFKDPRETVTRVSRGLSNLAEAGRIARYSTEKGDCIYVVNWERHQRIDKPNKPRLELPSPELQASGGDSRDSREGVASSQRIPAPGAGEQGSRGAGEETLSRTGSAGTHDSDPDDAVLLEPTEAGPSVDDLFARFWDVFPRRADKKKAREAFGRALKRADVETILRGAADYRADPNRDDAFTKYPATWLNADAWENDPLPARTQGTNAQDRRSEQIVDLVARNLPGHDAQVERGELEA